jgi:hypothetical protein
MPADNGHALRCEVCGDVIGVYEPTTVLVGEHAHHTSMAADASLVSGADSRFHRACFEARGPRGGGADAAAL